MYNVAGIFAQGYMKCMYASVLDHNLDCTLLACLLLDIW